MYELDELEKLIFYLETTSLEPHDDYTSEFTYKEQKILYKYITKLVNDKTKLQTNWNELKKWLKEQLKDKCCDDLYYEAFIEMNDKVQELEGNNEQI